MDDTLYDILVCPVHRTPMAMEVKEKKLKMFQGEEREIVWTAILFSEKDFFYPVIEGIPRLIVEAFEDYEHFFSRHLPDYVHRRQQIENNYARLIHKIRVKNHHTKKSFEQEWGVYEYGSDKTWDLDHAGLLDRFLLEADETRASMVGKWVLDAGCGNGHLNMEMAKAGIKVVGMDFSLSVKRAFHTNQEQNAWFVQGDVEFPPFPFRFFDLVHSSGVLIHTQRTELSFSCLEPCVKTGGKLSIWTYRPNSDPIHNLINRIRSVTSRLPVRIQYYLYCCTLLPVSYVVKKAKGNPQNAREMMIDILDWFSPRYRWEHEETEVESWFSKRQFHRVKVTDQNRWGFNMTGVKKEP